MALVERGFDLPVNCTAIVFDALDYIEVVRMLVSACATKEQDRAR